MDWRTIPSLSALRAFEATARLGSFSKAARELNVTHAAIAQHVRGLEKEFAETLVVRQGRSMALTARGAEFATGLREGFLKIAQSSQNLRNHSETRPLNVTLTPAFASSWLMPRLGDFWSRHPDITVNLNPSPKLIDLTRDEFDMAIRYGRGEWKDVTISSLTCGGFVVVAHPDVIHGRTINCLADLQDVPWLLESHMYERRALIENEGVCLDDAQVRHFDSNELVLAGLHAGLGMSVHPLSLVQRDLDSGRLAKICSLKDDGLGYYILTRKDRETAALKTFKKWLLAQV